MIRPGAVVRAKVPDPLGANKKCRPLVIVSVDEADVEFPYVGVAITGTFREPLADNEIKLPFHPQGLAKSGLTKASVAKCAWVLRLKAADIVDVVGFLPTSVLQAVIAHAPSG